MDYHYDRSGILKVHAKLRYSGTVILDEELDCFGPDGTPIAQGLDRELQRLLKRIEEPAPTAPTTRERTSVVEPTPAPADEEQVHPDVRRVVVDGQGIVHAGRTAASRRPPSLRLLRSALTAIKRRFPDHTVVTVLSTAVVDTVEHDERDILERGVAEGRIVTVPSAAPTAVLRVAEQLDAVVVSMEDLSKFRVPHPWIGQTGRNVKLARADMDWVLIE